MCCLIFIIPVLIISSATPGLCDRALVFQGANQLSNESRAVLYLSPDLLGPNISNSRDQEPGGGDEGAITYAPDRGNEVLSDLSVCLWLKVHYFRDTTSYVFSYATSGRDNNELNFGIRYNQILIAIGGKYVYAKRNTLYIPYTWYHFCFVADSQNKTGTFYINGEVHEAEPLSRRKILMNGSLVLGQETDQIDGGYQALQSFSGAITGFNLYSRALSASEVSRLFLCSPGVGEGDLVSWSKTEWDLHGPVSYEEVARDDYCLQNNFTFVVFPKKRTYREAKHLCSSLKSTMALPRNPKENSLLYQAAATFSDVCQPHNHATTFFWLGAIKNKEGNWTDVKGNVVPYKNFQGKQPLQCSGFKIPPYREQWSDVYCNSIYEFCSACQEEKPVILKMRGLCDPYVHSTYFRMVDQYGRIPSFRGYTKYNIKYDDNGTWALSNVWTGNTIAKFYNYEGEIPFGKRTWWTTTDHNICRKTANSAIDLSLSACYDWEYTCNDGSCIDLSQRCDLRTDCPDKTDEIGCEKLLKPKDYLKRLPPSGVWQGSPLLLNISLGIHGFSEINIRDMKLVIDFTMKINWTDSRLRYKNLSPTTDLNFIETDDVWLPKVELLNADFPKISKTGKVLNVIRISSPENDNPSRVFRDEVYEGENNPLQLIEKFNAPFSCTWNMRNFPFDKQHCNMLIRLESAKKEYLEWNEHLVNYLGEQLMAEYVVEDVTIEKDADEGYSLVSVNITFSRRVGYYMTAAYMPTIMLMIISYASLFCRKENCDLRVMMTLTTLLVLYGLYQQIRDDLPRTSYTKAIDVWCFFALTFIFSQVILHVFVTVRVRLPSLDSCFCYSYKIRKIMVADASEMTSPVASTADLSRGNCMNSDNCIQSDEKHRYYYCDPLALSRVLYVIVFVAFCAIYWTLVLNSE